MAASGHRRDRHKWFQSFSDLAGVILLVDVTCYDKMSYSEAGSQYNVLRESLAIFKQVSSLYNLRHQSNRHVVPLTGLEQQVAQKFLALPILKQTRCSEKQGS